MPAPEPARSARDPRRLVLDLVLDARGFPSRRFAAAAAEAGLDARDRAFARELLGGVLRWRRTLDRIFKPHASRRTVDPDVLWTLRLALYQRLFLDVPAYAAVAATLDAARPRLGRSTGFVNAVLRSVERGARRVAGEAPAEGAGILPLAEEHWILEPAPFADPEEDPVRHFGETRSLPDELVARWVAHSGWELTRARARACNQTPLPVLRVNRLRTSVEEVREALSGVGLDSRPGSVAGSLGLEEPAGDPRRLPGHAEGHWWIQDESAQAAAALAAIRPGERVLDLCAGPGGKSFALYEESGGTARILACEVAEDRLRRMEEQAARLGFEVECRRIAPEGRDLPVPEEGEAPDLVVLDVPCSNTGVLDRRPEARWRFGEEELRRCVGLQRKILRRTLPRLLGPRTRVLWSTCSLEPEENREMAERAARRAGLELLRDRTIEPGGGRGGGYAALLVPAGSDFEAKP